MIWMPEDRLQDDAVAAIRARCGELGLASWRCDREGHIIAAPDLDVSPFSVIIESAPLRRSIEQISRDAIESRSNIQTTIIEGVHLVAVPLHRRGAIVALHIDAQACDAQRLWTWSGQSEAADDDLAQNIIRHSAQANVSLDAFQQLLQWFVADAMQLDEQELAVNDLSTQLSDAYEQISAVYRIGRSMNCLTEPEMFVRSACNQHQFLLGFEWVAVQYIESAFAIESMRDALIVGGALPCDEETFAQQARSIISDWTADQWSTILEPGASPLADLVGSEIIIEPITHDREVIGAILAGNKTGEDSDVTSADVQLLDAASDFIGVFHQNVSRFEVQRTMFLGTVRAMSAAIDAKDPYTRGHSDRVAMLSRMIAEAYGMDESDLEDIHLSGLLHDIGKIGVPEAVLCKPGHLTDEEFDLIKRHPQIGHDILRDIPPMTRLLPGVLSHHERMDGKGYPHGLKGDEIPLFGRIIAVADAFDAMSSDRSYRARMSREKVLDILRTGAGTQWDAALIDAFMSLDLRCYDDAIATHVAQAPASRDAA